MDLDDSIVQFVINHVFFPPWLPNESDNEHGADFLFEQLTNVVQKYLGHVEEPEKQVWESVARNISLWREVYHGGTPSVAMISSGIRRMLVGDTLLLYIRPQNATTLLTRKESGMVFECFEVSSQTKTVLSCENALIRTFPEKSVFVPSQVMEETSFFNELCRYIHMLSIETVVPISMERITKGKVTIEESRESHNPCLVMDWLFSVLASRGEEYSSKIITKRTHDDVCWENTLIPWRRSAVWLSIKVTLQLAVSNGEVVDEDNQHYKHFMLFFMSELSNLLISRKLSSDQLHVIRTKLARRAAKIPSSLPEFINNSLCRAVDEASTIMQNRWNHVQAREDWNIPNLKDVPFDTNISLATSHETLQNLRTEAAADSKQITEQDDPGRPFCFDIRSEELPNSALFNCNKENQLEVVLAVQNWIAEYLQPWSDSSERTSKDCVKIEKLIEPYFKSARSCFEGHPELMSTTLLATVELWVALDRIVTRLTPLLLEYPAEIPHHIFQPLLLTSASELRRLRRVEMHLLMREETALPGSPSIFGKISEQSFAVQFFNSSERLQNLEQRIQEEAESEKIWVIRNFRDLKVEFDETIAEADEMMCDGWTIPHDEKTKKREHNRSCKKCQLTARAHGLCLEKFEEPLPDDESLRKMVVFELQPDLAFTTWRDATGWLMTHGLKNTFASGAGLVVELKDYPPLSKYYRIPRRFTLASTTKPNSATHRIKTLVTTVESAMLLPNGMMYEMCDTSVGKSYRYEQIHGMSISGFCRPTLPPGPYSLLGDTLQTVGNTQNSILSRQSTCPVDLSINEFISFGSMRSDGLHLQWTNLLRELLSKDLDLGASATLIMIKQICYEVGPCGSENNELYREGHAELQNVSFIRKMLHALSLILQRIQGSWKEANAASIARVITQKLLSVSETMETTKACIDILLNIRHMGCRWVSQLQSLLSVQRSQKGSEISCKETQRRLLETCLLVRGTWAVEPKDIKYLFLSEADLCQYFSTSLFIYDLGTQCVGKEDKQLQNALLWDQCVAFSLEHEVLEMLGLHPNAIVLGIQQYWCDAKQLTVPNPLYEGCGRWFTATFTDTGSKICFNIANGCLLVNGRPLGTLPKTYMDQNLYKQVVGEDILDVVASHDPQMEFMTTRQINGHELHFALRNRMLRIRAYYHDRVYEAVNRAMITEDIAISLIKDTIPWLCLDDGHIELRHAKSCWTSEESVWTLKPVRDKTEVYHMESPKHEVIDNKGTFGRLICKTFANVEDEDNLHIVLEKSTQDIIVELPRYGLRFLIDKSDGTLNCLELSAIVSKSQAIHTMHGLETKLVLQAEGWSVANPRQFVLVPYGPVKVVAYKQHVEVRTCDNSTSTVQFFCYSIDTQLRQLTSDGNLEAHLFKALLHATTSSCLPDQLIGMTGTQASLQILQDRLVWTSVPFSEVSKSILNALARLSPTRSFYPEASSKGSQTVTWDDEIAFLSQNDLFSIMVRDIAQHNSKAYFLYDDVPVFEPHLRGNDKILVLSNRTVWHWQQYCPIKLLEGGSPSMLDTTHRRNEGSIITKWHASFEISSLIKEWPSHICIDQNTYSGLKDLNEFTGFGKVFSPTCLTDILFINMAHSWPALLTHCSKATQEDSNRLVFIFSLIAFGNTSLLSKLRTLLAFAISSDLKSLGLPVNHEYKLFHGYDYNATSVSRLIDKCVARTLRSCFTESTNMNGRNLTSLSTRRLQIERQSQMIQTSLRNSWSESKFQLPDTNELPNFDYTKLQELLEGRFNSWTRNLELFSLCQAYDKELLALHCSHTLVGKSPQITLSPQSVIRGNRYTFPSLIDLMKRTGPALLADKLPEPSGFDKSVLSVLCEEHINKPIDNRYKNDRLKNEFGQRLMQSLEANDELKAPENREYGLPSLDTLEKKLELVNSKIIQLNILFDNICKPRGPSEECLAKVGSWPQPTSMTLLQLLSLEQRDSIPKEWQALLVRFATEITAVQRVARMMRYLNAGDHFALTKEVDNPAHASWSVSEHLDWLLLEIQNDMLIRPVQIRVAKEMVDSANGALQLGMGEGKSSVILPMAVVALSTGTSLVRVIVLKSLAKEMIASLSKTLSGLVSRPLYWLPFSRTTNTAIDTANQLRSIWEECIKNKGVLLALPEHINSFKLIGSDRIAAGQYIIGQTLLGALKWLDEHTRDIVDESDEILKPSYELVYSNGAQRPLSGTPHRWNTTLSVLHLVQECAPSANVRDPGGILYHATKDGSYPMIRILTKNGARILISSVLARIRVSALPGLILIRFSPKILEACVNFISNVQVKKEDHELLLRTLNYAEELQTMYLLRGFFACGYLQAAFEKRWFVEYGLDRHRCLSAVPYRAKSTPAAAAEFAQPDMMVLLTALSYYYTGLTRYDVHRAISLLLRLPDPGEEYAKWISLASVPACYRNINSVNLDDDNCIRELHDYLGNQQATIDFFLKEVVLIKESKEFPFKLSTSAWDLCSQEGGKITTGFSGTRDSKMPTSMPLKNPQDLRHSDAAVLLDLVQPRNRRYILAGKPNGQSLSTEELLNLIINDSSNPSVIIDVGAQMLERNEDIATAWLELRGEKLAVVFFDEKDNKLVKTREGSIEKWISSPLKQHLGQCLVYLDQFRTRGTDFQFPDNFTAAVLLGPSLQKDSWVQACMRMRKLAFSQSVVLIAPPEVDNDIRTILGKKSDAVIDSFDVIAWTIHNSCKALKSHHSLWIMRGLDYFKRELTYRNLVSKNGVVRDRVTYLDVIRIPESCELKELYPVTANQIKQAPNFTQAELKDSRVQSFLEQWKTADSLELWESTRSEEQEREMLREIEEEREVQRPTSMDPRKPTLNQAIYDIIRSNRITTVPPQGVVSAFELMNRTKLADNPLCSAWPVELYATLDFMQTIETIGRDNDDYLRPVSWVLKLHPIRELILIGPHEANAFIPLLRNSTVATLMIYSPRTAKYMECFDSLDVYRIPETSTDFTIDSGVLTCLRIFAGQLYFNNIAEYESFCELLGLWDGKRELSVGEKNISRDLFVSPTCRAANKWFSPFESSPVGMVKGWISMRRKGISWDHTHVGRVLSGQILTGKDFDT